MTAQLIDCEQNSPEWYAARLGIPTASEFSTVMAKGEGKVRKTYMLKLAGEILTGEMMESYTNGHMDRGKQMEEEARAFYSMLTDAETITVGFVRNGDHGCSPDRLIGANGGLEIKTMLPHLLIETHLRGGLPAAHKAQVQGALWTCEREWWDFAAYWPKLPLFVVRVTRDEEYIANLSAEVDKFNAELHDVVAKIRAMA